MKYKAEWEKLTKEMGYWVDMDNPYVTYDNKYMKASGGWLSNFTKKDYFIKDILFSPYSPKAGTGLSTHELNQPGCYRDVKDTSVAMFKIVKDEKSSFVFSGEKEISFVAWTTTPWTLPSNTTCSW